MRPIFAFLMLMLAALMVPVVILHASDAEKPVERVYAKTPPAPMSQTADQVAAKFGRLLQLSYQD